MTTQASDLSDLRALADRAAITDLVSRLGLWLDEKRFDDAGSVLTDEISVTTPGGAAQGVAAVADQARRNHADHHTQHVISNVLVTLDGDRAEARANLVVTFAGDGVHAPAQRTRGERYRFAAVRTPKGWRLSRIVVEPVWAADADQ